MGARVRVVKIGLRMGAFCEGGRHWVKMAFNSVGGKETYNTGRQGRGRESVVMDTAG